jgi:MFS family permease
VSDSPDDPAARASARSRLRRIAIDITPLRVSRDFRLVWGGVFISELGYQFTRVALYVQVFEQTGSTAAVGFLGLFGLAGQIAGTLVGGSFIDAHDRRRILLVAQIALAGFASVLLAGAIAGDPPLALLYATNLAMWFVGAIEDPARSAMTPRLVGRELVPSALTLYQALWQTVQLVGPAIAGVLIAWSGYASAYAVDVVTYAALFLAAVAMRPMPPEHDPATAVGWRAVAEGFDYVRRHRLLQSTFAVDLMAMIFGMPQALFPALALTQFHRGTTVVGLLFAAPALGALLQAIAGGWVKHVHRQGLAVIWAVIAWGAAIAAFGIVGEHLALALSLLAAAGAADVISAIFRSTILQVTVPDRLRGRLTGIHLLVVAGGPKLGDLESGLVASWFTPTISVITGGIACIAGAGVVAAIYPQLRSYRAPRGAETRE